MASLLMRTVEDLAAEHESLAAMLTDMEADDWDRETPAAGWRCRDQISHLAFFDDMASLAITDPTRFADEAELANPDTNVYMQQHLDAGRKMTPIELLTWWREASHGLLVLLRDRGLDLPRRLPWYGPSMGATSFVTARLMEAWAHGQDVADALGVRRRPTARLRHVAELGVRTRRFSYELRDLTAPDVDVEVRLSSPEGDGEWVWAAGATDRVVGPAEDFALVVTQRRHVIDTELQVTGDAAQEWMLIAQAFAGAPGSGRSPGSAAGTDVEDVK